MGKLERIKKLEKMQNRLIAAYVADTIKRGAEDYAPIYKKFPKLFKQLVKCEINTYRLMNRYFREFSERAIDNINWQEYQKKIASATRGATFKAGILDYLVKAFWENETLVLKIYLTEALVDAIEAGGLYTEQDLKVDVGWSKDAAPAVDFLNHYSLDLAKGLTQTSKDRVMSALSMSVNNGEDRDAAVERINAVIQDKVRSTAIAQTESVRAFSSARMEVGEQIGADRKQWRTAGAIDFCNDFENEGVVDFDYEYETPDGEMITEPPGHVNCRCGEEIFMPNEKV
jgi:hypothetical protein